MGWYKDKNGNPVWVDDSAPRTVPIGPQNPAFQYQGPQAAANLDRTRADMGNDAARIKIAQEANVRAAEAEKRAWIAQQADMKAKGLTVNGNGQVVRDPNWRPQLTPDKRAELQANLANIGGLEQMVAKLRNQYEQDFEGKGIGALAEYAPAWMRPENGVFNDNAQSLIADMAKAKGLTSQQFNTPAEQRMFFEPLVPKASDTDEQIKNKLANLEAMVGRGRSMTEQQLGATGDPLKDAQARLESQIANLPPQAQEIGRQRFYADPRIKRMMGKQGTAGAPRKQSNVIDFDKWGN